MAATATKKPTAKKITTPKAKPETAVSADPAADAAKPDHGPQLKKKELVDRVTEAVGGKKKVVKEIVEATLAALGEALQKGEALNLPPFGRAKIARSKGEGRESSMTVKLRGAGEKIAPKPRKEALAEVGEDS
ncbi:HU family DNA-binding protein [Paragemmobacter straminiformis]|uniref:HU family DNA-binding protein n=1 Tax=Paragemmobacter straminiformis TaxID=2045119 RepID=A0A842I7N5_9RHOB|nr:HU family DNA-binding protein [Gemmobacter straminiformis]MBC2835649.1 HU family DNA-binding protein [Gemmobacter straminiformis]